MASGKVLLLSSPGFSPHAGIRLSSAVCMPGWEQRRKRKESKKNPRAPTGDRTPDHQQSLSSPSWHRGHRVAGEVKRKTAHTDLPRDRG